MLMPLNKIAREIGVEESEARRLAIYAGLRRESGCYDDREFFKSYITQLHEKLYGTAAAETRLAEKPSERKKTVRGHLAGRKRANTPWAGPVLSRLTLELRPLDARRCERVKFWPHACCVPQGLFAPVLPPPGVQRTSAAKER
jgi:hypothetical protein